MEPSNIIALCALVMSSIQGVGACYAIADHRAKKDVETENGKTFSSNPLITSILLFVGSAVTLLFVGWMFWSKPLRRTKRIVDRTVFKKEYVPCSPPNSATPQLRGTEAQQI
jgi:hypothetical protein